MGALVGTRIDPLKEPLNPKPVKHRGPQDADQDGLHWLLPAGFSTYRDNELHHLGCQV